MKKWPGKATPRFDVSSQSEYWDSGLLLPRYRFTFDFDGPLLAGCGLLSCCKLRRQKIFETAYSDSELGKRQAANALVTN